MKRILLFIFIISIVLMAARVSVVKWSQISDVNTTLDEINRIHGLSSSVQDQLNGKVDTVDSIDPDTFFNNYTKVNSIVLIDSILNARLGSVQYAVLNVPAQNLVKYSETLENAAWSPTGLTVTANSSIDMNGATTLETVTASNVNNNLRFTDGSTYLPVVAGTTYRVSFDCRRGTMTDMKYSVMNVTTTTLIVDATSYYSQTNASNVSRVSYTFTAPDGCLKAAIYLLRDSGTVGQTVYLGRVQVTTVANAPYCVTTTTAVQ